MTATIHDTAKLWSFATHELDVGDASLLKNHLGDCPKCREDLLLVRSVRSLANRAAEAIPVLDWARIDEAVADLVVAGTARTAGLATASRRWHALVVPFAVLGAAAVALAATGGPSPKPDAPAVAAAAAAIAPAEPQAPTLLEGQGCSRGKDALKPGAVLSAGEVVKTGKGGFALVRLADGTRVRLGENAQLKLVRSDRDGSAASIERGRVAVQAERATEIAAGSFKARGVAGVFSVHSKATGVEIASAKGRVHVDRPGLLPMLVDTGRKASFTWKSSVAKMSTVSAADQLEFDKVILAPSVMVAALQRSMSDIPLASLTPAEAEVAAAEWSSPSVTKPVAQPAAAAAPVVAVAQPQPAQPVEARPAALPQAQTSVPVDADEFAAFPMSVPPQTKPAAKVALAPRRGNAPAAAVTATVALPEPAPAAAPVPARPEPEPTPIMLALSEPAPQPQPVSAAAVVAEQPAPAVPLAAEVAQPAPAPQVESPEMNAMREALDHKRDLRIREGMLIAEMQPTPKDVLEAEYAKIQARKAATDFAPMPAAQPAPAPVAAPTLLPAPAVAQPAATANESADEAEDSSSCVPSARCATAAARSSWPASTRSPATLRPPPRPSAPGSPALAASRPRARRLRRRPSTRSTFARPRPATTRARRAASSTRPPPRSPGRPPRCRTPERDV
ncbi:MAG: FecR domain-containing protein [Myxococcales bacterium]